MVKSGTVTSISRHDNSGTIEDKRGVEYFFSIAECEGNELPPLYSHVTFIKDADFKSTNVAALIKRSQVGNRAA